MMKLVYHGGKCCGIKTIYGMWTTPEETHSELVFPDEDRKKIKKDVLGATTSTSDHFFTDNAPHESGEERIKRYIEYMCNTRPSHIVEVVLNGHQKKYWDKTLVDLGFRLVNSNKNSNTSNTIHVYHLNILNGSVVKEG